uniref:PNPLA domain-containing protein n=1 Tax=Acrobeloides nanus TaxID=290746 RepID=A0A914BZZ3_9BILA
MESVNQFVQTASTSSISASDSSPRSPPDSSSTSSSDSESEEKPNPEKIGLSFSACGFLGSYHFGVMLSFQKNGKKLLSRVTCCGGASAGSLVAALCVLAPDKLKDGLDLLYKLANELHSMSGGAMAPGFYLAERLTQVVEPFIPEDISAAQNRLFISLTQQQEYYQIIQSRLASTFGYNQRGLLESNRVVSTFPSREYLIKCLMASCYIPIYSGGFDEAHPPPEIDGVRYIDGGFTNNLPAFEGLKMVTVSPFSGSADISPQDYSLHKILEWRITVGNQAMRVNMQNIIRGAQSLFPPSIERLQRYCEMGYRDGMSFLLRNGYLEREQGTEVGRSRDRVGELPLYHKTNEASQSYNANASSFNNSEVAAAGSWNSWDDRSFGIESKIEEYRTKRLVSNSDHETKEEEEQDYFQEMQPKIKAPSKVELLNAFKQSNNVAASQKNLFEFKEDFVDIRVG